MLFDWNLIYTHNRNFCEARIHARDFACDKTPDSRHQKGLLSNSNHFAKRGFICFHCINQFPPDNAGINLSS
eukprot:m.240057 g.240057  ORF g.240057 m.240057 type:complete len:72 (+) comp23064_c0_seq1:406-621(+)